jgi:DNA mismatch repair protein MutH
VRAPESERELLDRARALAGRTFAEIAARLALEVPASLARAKGFVGQLVEKALGATASSRPIPDFHTLGIEVKTLPIDRAGRPTESTYVSRLELSPTRDSRWESSALRGKLARILWVPVEADPSTAIAARRFGTAVLWSPSAEEERQLRADYEEMLELVAHGFVDSITAHRGKVLQIRPKAANAKMRAPGIDDEGGTRMTLPRGFYLRRKFTAEILERYFGPPENMG